MKNTQHGDITINNTVYGFNPFTKNGTIIPLDEYNNSIISILRRRTPTNKQIDFLLNLSTDRDYVIRDIAPILIGHPRRIEYNYLNYIYTDIYLRFETYVYSRLHFKYNTLYLTTPYGQISASPRLLFEILKSWDIKEVIFTHDATLYTDIVEHSKNSAQIIKYLLQL